jgi:hypothetical protein
MKIRSNKSKESTPIATAIISSPKQAPRGSAFQFADARPEALAQRKLQKMADQSSQIKKTAQFQAIADKHTLQQKPASGSAPVIQRYTDEGAYRVSDHKGLAVPKDGRPHEYFSNDELLEESRRSLQALESPVDLKKGAFNETLGLHTITAAGAHNEGADPHHPLKQSECIEVAAEILKARDTGKWLARIRDMHIDLNPYQIESIHKLIHPIVTSTSNHIRGNEEYQEKTKKDELEIERDTPIPGTGQTFIQNLTALPKDLFPLELKKEVRDHIVDTEMLIHKVMLFLKYLKEEGEGGAYREANEDNAHKIVKAVQTRVDKTYGGAFGYDSRQEEVTHGYQINEHAVAQLGEALAILSTGPRDEGSEKWNFHIAAVIAKDGNDTITMENETNKEDDREGNWAFLMYGSKKGQSFHEKHAYGTEKPVTVPISPKK